MYGKMPLDYRYTVKIFFLDSIIKTPKSRTTNIVRQWKEWGTSFEWNEDGLKSAYDQYLNLCKAYPDRQFKIALDKRELIELIYSPKMKKLVQYIKE